MNTLARKILSFIMVVVFLFAFGIFAIASGEDETETQPSETVTPSASTDSNSPTGNARVGDYEVIIDSCRLAKDYEKKPVVIVKYIFTNVDDDDPASFMWSIEDHVFQAGVGLNESYFLDDSANYSSDNATKEIKKGASITVEVAYVLNDTTSDVQVEVSEYLSFSNKKITKTFKLGS